MAQVKDALIIAAGLGTRMFPASAMMPKEALPLVDVPLMTHLVAEAKAAGVERLHLVTSPTKSFEGLLRDTTDLHRLKPHLDANLFNITNGLDVLVHVQPEPKGVGDAMRCALEDISGPVLVLLGDNLIMDRHATPDSFEASGASSDLVKAFERTGEATVGLVAVPESDVQRYGIVALEGSRMVGLVEKPSLEEAPSTLALCGRYVFPSSLKSLLDRFSYQEHGDLQSIAVQQHWMEQGQLHGHVFSNVQWYDSGAPFMWLQAQIDHALRREDHQDALRSWLERRLDQR
jgi:UTP--glucose-1-phosphate uridylyltransferase